MSQKENRTRETGGKKRRETPKNKMVDREDGTKSRRSKSTDPSGIETKAQVAAERTSESEKNRGKRLQECLQLLQMLQDHPTETWTFKELAREFYGGNASEAEVKSMKRLIEDLKSVGAPIFDLDGDGRIAKEDVKSRGSRERRFKYNKTHRFAKKLFELRENGFTPEELASLLMIEGLLEKIRGMHTRFDSVSSPMLKRLASLMPAGLAKEARAIADVTSFQGIGTSDKYIAKAEQIRTWEEAVLQRKQVKMSYERPGNDAREHVVAPLGFRLDFVNQSMLLVAAGAYPKKPAFPWKSAVPWKLDRVQSLEILDSDAPPIQKLLENSEGISPTGASMGLGVLFRNSTNSYYRVGEAYIDVEIAVTSHRWIEYIQEKIIHPNQSCDFPSDETRMILTISNCQGSNILPHILPMAPHFELLKPADLRDRVKKILEGALALHQD
jgi:predicted DNA-binding transcriptional regulator YafY